MIHCLNPLIKDWTWTVTWSLGRTALAQLGVAVKSQVGWVPCEVQVSSMAGERTLRWWTRDWLRVATSPWRWWRLASAGSGGAYPITSNKPIMGDFTNNGRPISHANGETSLIIKLGVVYWYWSTRIHWLALSIPMRLRLAWPRLCGSRWFCLAAIAGDPAAGDRTIDNWGIEDAVVGQGGLLLEQVIW